MSDSIAPLRLHHSILRCFSFVALGSIKWGAMLYVLLLSAISTYLFFRLVRACGLTSHSFYITVLFLLFPVRCQRTTHFS
jgi:hypothetical protein